jgi:hypothetical protein
MRREEKEIRDIAVIEQILNSAMVCRVGLCDGDRPYVVPLCFGYKENALYFHSAKVGRKLDIIRKNSNVCFEVDISHELVTADKACDFGMRYKSVIGFGKALIIEDAESKRKGLDIIMQQYSNGVFEYPKEACSNTVVIKIEIESMTGKLSG